MRCCSLNIFILNFSYILKYLFFFSNVNLKKIKLKKFFFLLYLNIRNSLILSFLFLSNLFNFSTDLSISSLLKVRFLFFDIFESFLLIILSFLIFCFSLIFFSLSEFCFKMLFFLSFDTLYLLLSFLYMHFSKSIVENNKFSVSHKIIYLLYNLLMITAIRVIA